MTADTTKPRFRRRYIWLVAAIVTAIALYTGGWFYVAGLIDGEASKAIASANRNGVRLNCENSEVRGYPFRLGLNCQSVYFEDATEGVSFSAGAFRTTAQVYNPTFLVGELDGVARLEAPGLQPLTFDWDVLRSSVRLAEPLPSRVSIEGRKFRASIAKGDVSGGSLFSAESLEAHMRPDGAALDLAGAMSGFAVDRSLTGPRELPVLNGNVDLVLADGVRWAVSADKSLRGHSGTLRQLNLSPGPESSVNASGTFSVDHVGFVDAELAISVRGSEALADTLIRAFPEAAGQIASFAASLNALGDDTKLPLRVAKGEVSYGFIELGRIPPLP